MLERVNAPFFQEYLPNIISNLTPIVYYLAIDSFQRQSGAVNLPQSSWGSGVARKASDFRRRTHATCRRL